MSGETIPATNATPRKRAAEPNLSGHMPALDGVRGMAILAVCLFHFSVIAPAGRLHQAFAAVTLFGWTGVDLFFALSGFLITGILLDSKEAPHYFRNFYMRRVLRIFPLYYAVVTVCLVIAPHLHNDAARFWSKIVGGPGWYWLYFCNFAMARHNDFGHGALAVAWSLAIEEQFYMFWPVLVLVLRRRQLIGTCIGAAVLALTTRFWLDRHGAGWVALYVLTPCRVDSLCAGALVAALLRSPGGVTRLLPAFRKAAIVFFVLLIGLWIVQHQDWIERAPARDVGYTLLAGFFASFLPIAISLPARHPVGLFLTSAPMRMLGRYSYAMYLLHQSVSATVFKIMHPARLPDLLGSKLPWQLLFDVIALTATVCAALLSWTLFERPILRLKRFFPVEREAASRARGVSLPVPAPIPAVALPEA